jgi:hypothetical protein
MNRKLRAKALAKRRHHVQAQNAKRKETGEKARPKPHVKQPKKR